VAVPPVVDVSTRILAPTSSNVEAFMMLRPRMFKPTAFVLVAEEPTPAMACNVAFRPTILSLEARTPEKTTAKAASDVVVAFHTEYEMSMVVPRVVVEELKILKPTLVGPVAEHDTLVSWTSDRGSTVPWYVTQAAAPLALKLDTTDWTTLSCELAVLPKN
jgi:hypothetical protein